MQQASRLSIPQLSPFTPIKVPQSILNMSKKQIQARNERENASRSLINNSAANVNGQSPLLDASKLISTS